MNRLALAAAALAVAPLLSGAAHNARAQAAFDGNWSVTIITEKGACDKAYNYPLSVKNGTVGYPGKGGFDISGRVNRTRMARPGSHQPRQPERGRLRPSGDVVRVRHLDGGRPELLGPLARIPEGVSGAGFLTE